MREAGERPGGPRLVVVPKRPGPLLDIPTQTPRQRDDLDELLDDSFGEPTREGPGLFDIALILTGVALAVAGPCRTWRAVAGRLAKLLAHVDVCDLPGVLQA
jgi:hypothetical protein